MIFDISETLFSLPLNPCICFNLFKIQRLSAGEKNIAILCNPLAGVGKASRLAVRLANELQNKKISFTIFNKEWPADFTGFSEVWIVGGDGTLNYFVNYYPGIQVPFAVFKGGTGNDFYRLLYKDISLGQQLQLVLHTPSKPIDAGRCNGKYFLNIAGIGFEGSVVQSLNGKKKLPGKTSFYITILKKIFFYRSQYYSISDGNKIYTGNKLMVSVTNGRSAGGGFFISPEARPDDGLLDVILIDKLTPLKRIKYLPVIEKGKHLRLPFVTHFTATRLAIKSDTLMQYHLDGEYGAAHEISIEIVTHKLRVLY
ncbi:MAG TPA: YegS/Rv2252/BmrU family lipid kinase [Chitinophagaceae bacterium]|nr:YegS/Rv2252/BmrU family lipid kinase [Chitinophagaceae bacterium]